MTMLGRSLRPPLSAPLLVSRSAAQLNEGVHRNGVCHARGFMSESNSPRRGILGSVGPAIITASVVLGPGSILTSSRVGCDFGYQMIWVLASAGVLMWSMVALSARLGVELDGTLCEELSQRAGRPIAVLAGGSLFLVAACFQFSNNLAIFAGIEPFVPKASATVLWQTPSPFSDGTILKFGWPSVAVVLVNVAIGRSNWR
jgi:hypothetical protein